MVTAELVKIPECWSQTNLQKITTEIGDGIHSTPKYVKQSQIFFINGNNLIQDFIKISDNTKRIDELEFKKHRKNINENTLLLSINGTIGNLAFYKNEKVVLGKSIAYINLQKNINQKFVFYFLKSNFVKNFIYAELTASTIKNLSLATVREIPIILPNDDKEQQKIVQILSDTNELVKQLDYLITKKKNIKRGTMQNLLTGKIRLEGFTEEWQDTTLGSMGIFSKGKGLPKNNLDSSGKIRAIPYTSIYTDFDEVIDYEKIDLYSSSEGLKVINEPHLLIAGSSNMLENVGKVTAYDDNQDVAIGGDIILYKTNMNVIFLSYLLTTKTHRNKIVSLSQGSTIRHVYKSTFEMYLIKIPKTIEEQNCICEILLEMDLEIQNLEKHREKYIKLEEGMMQKLLTGEIRLT